jgi:hypothetical protein
LVDFVDKKGGPNETYILTSMFKCTLAQDKLEEHDKGLYTHGQMIYISIHGQISYNCWLSNGFLLKLRQHVKRLLLELIRATGKEIAEHGIRLTKVFPASCVKARCEQLLISIHRLRKVLKRVEEREKRRERRMVGKRMILVLM